MLYLRCAWRARKKQQTSLQHYEKLNPALKHKKKILITNVPVISFTNENYFKINSSNDRLFSWLGKMKKFLQSNGISYPFHTLLSLTP